MIPIRAGDGGSPGARANRRSTAGEGARSAIRRLIAVAAAAATTALGACAPQPPMTSYETPSGAFVTIDWSEFPAYAYTDAEKVLEGPVLEQVPQRERLLLGAIEAFVEHEFAVSGSYDRGGSGDEPMREGSNGYGGDSLLLVHNSPSRRIEVEIPQWEWDRVLDGIGAIAAGAGLEATGPSAEWSDASHESRTFSRGGEFLDVTVGDARLDDAALAEPEQYDWLIAGIEITYGIATVRQADRAEFARRAAPFIGRDWPTPTGSD